MYMYIQLGIFRHQVRILEEEKECLSREKDQFNDQCNVLTERVREYEEQEQVMKEKERDREELIEKLSAAQATISLLTKQVHV